MYGFEEKRLWAVRLIVSPDVLAQQMQPQQATSMPNGHAGPLLSQPLAPNPAAPAPAVSAISLASSMCSDGVWLVKCRT